MKLNKIAASCALALAAMSGQAYALTAFDTPDVDLFLSGASAPQNILAGVASSMFDPGFFVFYDDAGTPATMNSDDGKNYRAYFGVVKTGNGALSGKKVMLQHRGKGGSVWGVDPVARKQGIANMNVSAATCTVNTTGTATTYGYACAARGEDLTYSTALPNRVPDFGVSDLEPNMFKGPYNVEPGATQLSQAEAATLTNFGTNAVMFGVPVTSSVGAAAYISKAAFGGMLNGDVQDWTLVDASLAPAGGKTQVIVCRRVQGSGTQATYNSMFSHFPCETGSIAGSGNIAPATAASSASIVLGTTGTGTAADPFILNPADGYTVVENSSSGAVRTCLQAAARGNKTNDTVNGVNPITFQAGDGKYYKIDFGTGGYGATGILSMESAGSENGWSFRALDGVAPTKANMLAAKYDLVVEQSIQYRTDTPAGLKKDFMNLFITKAGDPNVLLGISNVAVRNSVAALPIGANDPTTNSNVMVGTRYGNSCSPIRKLY